MKRIVLIGATGFVGSAILEEALNRNIQVTAIARDTSKIKLNNKNLITKDIDIFSTHALSGILRGMDAVISAYSPGFNNPYIVSDTIKGYASILEGVKRSGVKRLQVVGGAGSLFVSPEQTVIDSGKIPKEMLPGVKALKQVLTEILQPEKELDWVFFSPAATLKSGQRTGKYRLGLNNLIVDSNGISEISVEDYAKAMIDEFENPKHHQQRFTIGY